MADLWGVLLGGVLSTVGGLLAPVLHARSARRDRARQRELDHFERVRAFDIETIVTLRIALDALADFYVFPLGAAVFEFEEKNPNGHSFEALNTRERLRCGPELSTILNPVVRASAQLYDQQLRARVAAFVKSARALASVSHPKALESAVAVRDEQAALEALLGERHRQLVRALEPKQLGDVRTIESG